MTAPGRFERHVFICTNERAASDARGCCHARGAEEVHDAFKKAIKERGLSRRFRANRSGCLDACARGVTVVVYPDGVWYGGVSVADVPEIIDRHLLGGEPVERLRLPETFLRAPH